MSFQQTADNALFDGRYEGNTDKIDIGILIKKLENAVSSILKSVHKQAEKQKIELLPAFRPERMNFACPYCGDSKLNSRKKRGNIYLDDFNYKCWNAGCRKSFTTATQLLIDFNQYQNFDQSEIFYMQSVSHGSLDNPLTLFQQGKSKAKSNDINDLKDIDKIAITRDTIMNVMGLKEIENVPHVYEYLKGRNQIRVDNRHFAYDFITDSVALLNLTANREKVIGVQFRYMKKNTKGIRFKTIPYSEIITKYLGIKNADDGILYKMDRVCLLYNILSVDIQNKPVIFEGGMDANHMPNSIATLSASTKINLPNGLYLYDNTRIDQAGLKESVKMLKEGYKVFLWGKFFDENKKYGNYYAKLKDLDDIVRFDNKFNISLLYNYFSNDKLDILYL